MAIQPIAAHTVASAIQIGDPVNYTKAARVVRDTEGVVTTVSDAQLLDAKAAIDRAGIGCEPASATGLAGIARLVAEGVIAPGERVLTYLTGHVLKDTETIVKYHLSESAGPGANRPIVIDPTPAGARPRAGEHPARWPLASTSPAPAPTSGPGFDCLGLALDLWLRVDVTPRADGDVRDAGSPDLLGGSNLVIEAMRNVAERRGFVLPGCEVAVTSAIPVARGLGSSAAAIVAGMRAASVLAGYELSDADADPVGRRCRRPCRQRLGLGAGRRNRLAARRPTATWPSRWRSTCPGRRSFSSPIVRR